MSFLYLVHKYSLPQTASSSPVDELKSPRMSNQQQQQDLKSPKGGANNNNRNKPTSPNTKTNNSEKEHEPPKPIEEVILLNYDMDKSIVLLDKIKEMCCFQDVEHLDLVNFKTGECVMIHLDPFAPGSKYLKKGEKYFPCKVIIQTIPKPSTPSNAQTNPNATLNDKKKTSSTTSKEQSNLPEIEKTFISLVSGDAIDQLPTIIDPTRKSSQTKKK